MRRSLVICSFVVLFALPGIASSEDAQSILDKARAKQVERWEGVASYIVDQSMMGNRTVILYERIEVRDAAGNAQPAFRMVPLDEIEKRRAANAGVPNLSSEELELFATSADLTGAAVEKGMQESGMPAGIFGASGMGPRAMMGDVSTFLRKAAEAGDGSDGSAEAQEGFSGMEDFAETARLVGKENVDGRKAFHLRADDIKRTQAMDGGEFTLQSISLWIDAEKYVPLKLQMDGIAKSGKETRPIRIEKLDEDYRNVAGSNMYESFRQVMRIGGILSAKDQREMQRAQKEFAKFEEQMQQMPAAQRNMIMKQMGPQMAMMKQMASGGGFEVVTEIHSIRAMPGG
jgi:hypothetical protein